MVEELLEAIKKIKIGLNANGTISNNELEDWAKDLIKICDEAIKKAQEGGEIK